MKDPLSNEVSYYDILGVSIDASSEEVELAFKRALGLRKYTPQQIANARKQLLDAESRLQADFFLYSNEYEKEIDFNTLTKGCIKSVDKFNFEIDCAVSRVDARGDKVERLHRIGDTGEIVTDVDSECRVDDGGDGGIGGVDKRFRGLDLIRGKNNPRHNADANDHKKCVRNILHFFYYLTLTAVPPKEVAIT